MLAKPPHPAKPAGTMDNPYQASSHSAYPASNGIVTRAVIDALAATRPWVRLCSVLGFIGAGFMILAALAIMVTGTVGALSSRDAVPFAGFPIIIGFFYLVMAALYLVPSLKLWKYGSAIVRLMSSNAVADLEAALDQQRGFWKFVGIMMIIMIAFMVLAFVGGMVAAMAGAAAMSK